MLALAVPIGLLIGLSLGALGGGGSILTVPALVYLLDQSPHSATTASLVIVGITALAGVGAHWRSGRVRAGQGMAFGALGLVGSYVGSRLSANVDAHVLLTAFAALMLVAAAAMFRRCRVEASTAAESAACDVPVTTHRRAGRAVAGALAAAPQRVTSSSTSSMRHAGRVVAAATLVGLLTGFFGVGGGFVIVPALVLALGFDMPTAVGTSLLVIAINSSAALAVRLGSHSSVDWALLSVFTAAAVTGTLFGSRVTSRVEPRKLTLAFAVLLVLVAGYMAARSVPQLA